VTASKEIPATVELKSGEYEKLPVEIQDLLEENSEGKAADLKWVLFGTNTIADHKVITRVANAYLSMDTSKIRAQLREERINKLLNFYLEGETRAEVELELERDNALLRANYLKITESYTAMQIRSFQSGEPPKNPSDPAARWKREQRIFAVPHGNIDLFPAFQIQDGTPHPSIKKVLKHLPGDMSAWQVAFWFSSDNGWLNGKSPKDRLNAPDDLVEAVVRLNDSAIG